MWNDLCRLTQLQFLTPTFWGPDKTLRTENVQTTTPATDQTTAADSTTVVGQTTFDQTNFDQTTFDQTTTAAAKDESTVGDKTTVVDQTTFIHTTTAADHRAAAQIPWDERAEIPTFTWSWPGLKEFPTTDFVNLEETTKSKISLNDIQSNQVFKHGIKDEVVASELRHPWKELSKPTVDRFVAVGTTVESTDIPASAADTTFSGTAEFYSTTTPVYDYNLKNLKESESLGQDPEDQLDSPPATLHVPEAHEILPISPQKFLENQDRPVNVKSFQAKNDPSALYTFSNRAPTFVTKMTANPTGHSRSVELRTTVETSFFTPRTFINTVTPSRFTTQPPWRGLQVVDQRGPPVPPRPSQISPRGIRKPVLDLTRPCNVTTEIILLLTLGLPH